MNGILDQARLAIENHMSTQFATAPLIFGPFPLITVIVPAYNCATYLPEALDSILSQQYPNLEIIVVDDSSVDGCAEIADDYGPPVRVIRQQNQGPAAARNRAAREAKGEYLAFLDGDDLWLPGKLKDQMTHLLAHRDIGIVYGGFCRWYADKNGTYPSVLSVHTVENSDGLDLKLSGWIYHHLLIDNYIHIITAIVSRSLFEILGGFDESLRIGEDYDFWLRATQLVQAHKLARDVALYRVNPASTTHIPRTVNYEQVVVLRAATKYGLSSPDGAAISQAEFNNRLSGFAFGHGFLHFWHGSPCVALDSFREAIKFRGKRLKTIMYFFLSYLRCKLSRFIHSYNKG